MHTRRALGQATRRALSLLVAATLALSPVTSAALATPSRPTPTAEQIEQMLQQQAYVPGEVIVVAEAEAHLDGGEEEQLAEAGDDALDLTADAALAQADTAQAVSAERAQASDALGYEVTVVRSSTKTTAQLIEELYANPQVISVEPNYLTPVPDDDPQASEAVGALVAMAEGIDAADPRDPRVHPVAGDLSAQQWYLRNTGTYGTPEGAAVEGVDMDVPGWDAFHDGSAGATINSSGVIAILDSGLDIDHPDLAGVLYTFTPDQQARYHCGPHGLNVAEGDGSANLTDHVGHGTHVSGIAAAAWDGEGISGVANGARLIGVRLDSDGGVQTMEAGVRAFSFLAQCAKEINLKSVNCSWASPGIEFTYSLLINQLGMQGAVTVFAAGNNNQDAGKNINTPSISSSPYLISVDALNPAGERAGFSDYSATSTDVFAPGAQMLSSVPAFSDMSAAGREDKILRSFIPTSATEEGVLAFEDFSGAGASQVVAYASDPTQPGATQIGAAAQEYGVDDAWSYRIPTADIEEDGDGDGGSDWSEDDWGEDDWGEDDWGEDTDTVAHSYEHAFYLAVPVADGATDISYVSARLATGSFSMDQMDAAVFGVVARTGDGGTKLVDLSRDTSGCYDSANVSTGWFSWLCSTLDVAHLIEADDEAVDVYRDDQGRIILKVAVNVDPTYEALYLDNLAVGGPDARAGAYRFMNGTSMAAPAVAGALAVLARDEEPNAASDDPAQLALERAGRLRAATVWSESLDGLCATGGYVNLREYATLASTTDGRKAPIIVSATEEGDGSLRVEGHFFGAGGSALVDGAPVEARAWADGSLELILPADLPNGAHVLTVITPDGRDKFAFSSSARENQLKLYETELALPDFAAVSDRYEERGLGPLKGCMVASGDYLYMMHTFTGERSGYLWRYHIADDSWELCTRLPVPDEYEPYGTILAATEGGGLLLYVCEVASQDDELISTQSLYDYDPQSNAWTKRDVPCALPEFANIFVVGKDVYFVGGSLPGVDQTLYLSVLRAGADQVEVLDDFEQDGYDTPLYPTSMTKTDGCIYMTNAKSPYLVRIKVDEGYRAVEATDLTDSLRGKVYDARRITNPPCVAGVPDGVFVVGTELEGTDTHLLADDASELEPFDYTSSFYPTNQPMALWHDGVLYVMGYSPSEPDRIYFRAHRYPVDETDEEPSDDPADKPDEDTPDKRKPSKDEPDRDEPDGKKPATDTRPAAASTSPRRPLPKTGDEPLPLAALLGAGVAFLAAGVVAKICGRANHHERTAETDT